MKKKARLAVSVFALSMLPVFAHAQQAQQPRQPVTVTTILQRPEVRVIRVAIQPNSTRTMHAHPDALFHLFMPLDGTIELAVEGKASEQLGPWQAHFFKGGAMHAFTNASGSVVQWMEVFVQKTSTSAGIDVDSALALALAGAAATDSAPR